MQLRQHPGLSKSLPYYVSYGIMVAVREQTSR